MADIYAGLESPLDTAHGVLRRCRGRPRLNDTDRALRRLESRKKYDVRRVYLGEAHRRWTDLRDRTSLSDAGLAEYLMLLDSTYGEKYLQHRHGDRTTSRLPGGHTQGSTEEVSSLQGLVSWYQDHRSSCPYEPRLRGLEPQEGPAAAWRCPARHSFLLRLHPPPEGDSSSESPGLRDPAATQGRREGGGPPRAHSEGASEHPDVCGDQRASAPENRENRRRARPTGRRDPPALPAGGVQGADGPKGGGGGGGDDGAGDGDEGDGGGREVKFAEELEMAAGGYSCVVMATALTDTPAESEAEPALSHLGADPEQGASLGADCERAGPFEPHGLRTLIDGCQIQGQGSSLEGPQLIIITGRGFAALAPEGLQLSGAPGAEEEVTCTGLQGGAPGAEEEVTCTGLQGGALQPHPPSDAQLGGAGEDAESVSGLSPDPVQEAPGPHLESSCERERPLGGHRPPGGPPRRAVAAQGGVANGSQVGGARRRRRGPVTEADGLLKMFHCPHAGCSQVYLALSSYQNHVNLVHRKGRTKVCPHPGCGKKFYLSNHLHRHMIIHSGVRDFICETCGKSFKRKNHLEVHRRTHTGETPLQCEVCGFQCRQRASLNWHMKKHRTDEQHHFVCQHCGKRFEKLQSVKFHRLKSHPEQQAS